MIYPRRIQEFRDSLIRELPSVPRNREARDRLRAMPTSRLILAFLNWRMRFVPARPRTISAWSGGISPSQFRRLLPEIKSLLDDVESGRDLTPRLSTAAWTKGIVLPGAAPRERGKDIDATLIRMGLHHFHTGTRLADNPTGRSNLLVFAHVMENEFRIISVSDHTAFDAVSAEQQAFVAYGAREIPQGQGFMITPVMASGHSLEMTVFADHCDFQMRETDHKLDDPETAKLLYASQIQPEAALVVPTPPASSLAWRIHDLRVGIFDKKTGVFFPMWSFMDR